MSATPSQNSNLAAKKSAKAAYIDGSKAYGKEGPSKITIVSLAIGVGLLTILGAWMVVKFSIDSKAQAYWLAGARDLVTKDFRKVFAIARPDPTTPARVPEENQKIVAVGSPPPRAEPMSTKQTVSEPVHSPKTTDSENTPIPEAAPEPTTAYHFGPGPGNPESVFPHSSANPAAISVQAPPYLSPRANTPNQGVKTRRATAVSPTPTQVRRAEPVQPEDPAARVRELKTQIGQLKEERKILLENENLLESIESERD